MRKNSIRKLIHGILDLLPLFVIPIFAININQKSVEPIQVEVQEKISVDFNQLVSLDNIEYSNVSNMQISDNGLIEFDTLETFGNVQWRNIDLINGHKYYIGFNLSSNVSGHSYFFVSIYQSTYLYQKYETYESNILKDFDLIFTSPITAKTNPPTYLWFQFGQVGHFSMNNMRLFDLTQMFGEGNEPSIEVFRNMFPNNYYQYTESQKMLVDKPTTTIYNDTDIGSQFLYSLYISTDNYFNMNNVFNLNGVYSWFEMNIFGGSAPLSIYIVWNIIIYELVMDLLMLLYALFMFFIDACQKLIDKPLESIK